MVHLKKKKQNHSIDLLMLFLSYIPFGLCYPRLLVFQEKEALSRHNDRLLLPPRLQKLLS
jgi:hypothetical protein